MMKIMNDDHQTEDTTVVSDYLLAPSFPYEVLASVFSAPISCSFCYFRRVFAGFNPTIYP